MEGRIRFFFGQFFFSSSILTLISISIIKKNFLGHTDILTYGNDNDLNHYCFFNFYSVFYIDFLSIKCPSLSKSEFSTVCRDMCSEARQRIWSSDPKKEFEVGGKILKKGTKSKQRIHHISQQYPLQQYPPQQFQPHQYLPQQYPPQQYLAHDSNLQNNLQTTNLSNVSAAISNNSRLDQSSASIKNNDDETTCDGGPY
jgi:hypothetical protein